MFKPGKSGNPKGRRKGATDMITRAAKESIDQKGLIKILQRLASGQTPVGWDKNTKIDNKLRFDATRELLAKVMPNLKAVEHSGQVGMVVEYNTNVPDIK